ncbi:MAG: bile acid:sodium symporter [Candidatus Schmidhempelia sp.]|nr:bile acid:sodium symporter [Candidatus Schmidhempelia sp.]
MQWLTRLKIDSFLLILITVVIIATLFPCEGHYKTFFEHLSNLAIALLFFMHGAKLSLQSIMDGFRHWRLHLVIFCITFVVFPLFGIILRISVPFLLSQQLYIGFLYLCALPATVQSAIAFTSIAKGNVAAAICSASASTLLGVFISPLLVNLLIDMPSVQNDTFSAIMAILLKLMLPFVIGHLCRPWLINWLEKYRTIINKTDRTSILLVVYVAFSEAVSNGIWYQVNGWSLLSIIFCSLLLLVLVLIVSTYSARLLGFNKKDEITIVFCGSKKSLASGIPMASVLFPTATIGMTVLPLMVFHQIQLMICAIIAAHYASRSFKNMPRNQ